MSISYLPSSGASGRGAPLDNGGGPPHDPGMEDRVKKLEEFVGEARTELRAIDVRLAKIETRLDQTSTKSDLTEAVNGQIKWIVGTAVALGVAAITVMTFVLNNAVPKASAPSVPVAPIVIYAQPGSTPPPATAPPG